MPRVTEEGPFARQRLLATVAAACRHAGLDPTEAHLIHITVNAIFLLPRDRLVLRITAASDPAAQARHVTQIARWLASQDVPAVRLAPVSQPLLVEESRHAVTYWRYLPQEGPPLGAGDLGQPLRRLHALPLPPFPLPAWRPLHVARARIARHAAHVLTAEEHRWFTQRADDLQSELDHVDFPLARAVIHGDAYIGNLLRDESGGPVLCDLDSMCLGPVEWDLIPELVGHRRYHRPATEYQRLVDEYGFDPRTWQGHRVLCELREYLVLTSVLPVLDSSAGIADEFRLRLDAMRRGDTAAIWTPFGRAA